MICAWLRPSFLFARLEPSFWYQMNKHHIVWTLPIFILSTPLFMPVSLTFCSSMSFPSLPSLASQLLLVRLFLPSSIRPSSHCSFLGYVDMYGSHFEDNYVATGYGTYLALPLIRKHWRADLSFDEAKHLLFECMKVLIYRDCRTINSVGSHAFFDCWSVVFVILLFIPLHFFHYHFPSSSLQLSHKMAHNTLWMRRVNHCVYLPIGHTRDLSHLVTLVKSNPSHHRFHTSIINQSFYCHP